jgi:LysR family transcriptional regulator, benzoate and cis,cis-muconate-responsive activator of ben and cat genes
MELRQLRYFATVARELNFTRAAARLHVAQPALSRQVKQLEAELGVALLTRNNRQVRLTPHGESFLAEAEQILQQSDGAMQRVRANGSGAVNIGYVWGLFHSTVPQILQRFRALEPSVAVHLFDMPAATQGKALAQGKLDAGFIGLAFEAEAAGLEMRRVGTTQFVLALPERHALARRRAVDLRALEREVFLLISEEYFPGASRVMREACRHAGFKPRMLEVERGHTILSLVASGCGVALLPEPLRALPHASVVFRPPTEPITADLFVAWRKGLDASAKRSLLAAVEKPNA